MAEEKRHTFILSDESQNDYGSIVRTAGIDQESFKKNPIMLFNHNDDKPIGRWENLRVDGTQLLADAVFDMEDEEAKKIANKVERGFLKGASATIQAKTLEIGTPEDENTIVLATSILREASVCSLPSNSNTLRLMSQSGEMFTKESLLQLSSTLKSNSNNDQMDKLLAALIGVLQLSSNATQEDATAAIKKLVKDNETFKSDNESLKTKVEEFNTTRATDLFELALSSGKVKAEQKDSIIRFAKTDYEGAKEMISALKPHVSLSSKLNNKEQGDGTGVTEDRASWSFQDWQKKDSAGLLRLKSSAPDQYEALVKGVRQELISKGAIEG